MGISVWSIWLVLGAATEPVHAQEVTASGDSLEMIVVTARKRAETIQSAPVAIFAITGDQMKQYALTDLTEASTQTPGLLVGSGGVNSGASIYLRGVGSSLTSFGFDQAVAIVVENVPVGQGRILDSSFFDMQQIEVLKGPQALFFGKNSTAGVVSVKTADPTDKREITLRAGYEFKGNQHYAEFIASGPLTDTWLARLALHGEEMSGGFFKNYSTLYTGIYRPQNGPTDQDIAGRLTVVGHPADNFDVNFKIALDQYKNDGPYGFSHMVDCQGPGGTEQPRFGVPAASLGCGLESPSLSVALAPDLAAHKKWGRDGQPYMEYHSEFGAANLTYRLDNFAFTSVTGFYHYTTRAFDDFTLSTAGQTFGSESVASTTASEELRIASEFQGPLNFTAGLFYDHTTLFLERPVGLLSALPPDPVTGSIDTFNSSGSTHGNTISVFFEGIWNIAHDLELSAGARWSHQKKSSVLTPLSENPFFAFVSPLVSAPIHDEFSGNNVSPSATLTWHATSDFMLYGSYRTGYKSGGSNIGDIPFVGSSADSIHFGPEKALGGELGAKLTLLHDSLQIRAAVYDYKYKDLQVEAFNPVTLGAKITNAGVYFTKGVELDTDFKVPYVSGLTVHSSVDYNHATYDEYIGQCYTGQTVAEGCNLEFSAVTGAYNAQNYAGRPGANAPKWTATLGGTWNVMMPGGRVGLGASTDGRFVSSYFLQGTLAPQQVQSSYLNLSASLRVFDAVSDRWEIALIGRNLTNKLVGVAAIDTPGTGFGTGTADALRADTTEVASRPREIALQGTFNF
jgi:outer membrane receptor protein involved in Fe transport